MPLNSVFHIMLFDIITVYENEVFNTLFRPQFNNTCSPTMVRYGQLYQVKLCLVLISREIFRRTPIVMNYNC